MAENLRVIGKTTTCMGRESIPGLMVVVTREIMKMIKSMVRAFTLGVMEDNTVVNG